MTPSSTLIASVLALTVVAAAFADEAKKEAAKPAAKADAKPAAAAAPAPADGFETEEQRTIYALGLAISQNIEPFSLSAAELEILKQGLSDGILKRTPKCDIQVYGPKLQPFAQERQGKAAEGEKKLSVAFLAKAEKEPGAKKTASGLIYKELKAGTGDAPKATDKVKVHYHGTLMDGTVFDSSVDRGEPTSFPLNGVIPCWTEGLQLMKVGGKSRLTCPSSIAYGDRGAPPKIKPGASLVFEVELLAIEK